MSTLPTKVLHFLLLALLGAGALAVTSRLPDPETMKAPLMAAALAGLLLLRIGSLRITAALIPALLLLGWAWFRLSPHGTPHQTGLVILGGGLAFLLGYVRAPIAGHWIIAPIVLVCIARGVMDLVTLAPLGAVPVPGGPLPPLSTMASFFADKHAFGVLLILAAFHHFYLMERGDPHKPVQVLLYASVTLILLALTLTDSRLAQGVFFLCFLALLFLSLRLDFKEPSPERLAWIMGITLCLGLAWLNLPERHWNKTAALLASPDNGGLRWNWSAAWRAFEAEPYLGSGTGGFRFAATESVHRWPRETDDHALPRISHAHNHFLETLAEQGLPGALLEAALALAALAGMAWAYYRSQRAAAKYAFFSLSALLLAGVFSRVLETLPARFVYWALIGYGFSLAVGHWGPRLGLDRAPPRRMEWALRGLLAAALIVLTGFHEFQSGGALRADWFFVRAMQTKPGEKLGDTRTRVNNLADALRMNPWHEEANYAYARMMALHGQRREAVLRLTYVQKLAPDRIRHAEAMAHVYATLGDPDSAGHYAALVLARHPNHLPSLELMAAALLANGRCDALEALNRKAETLDDLYPLPSTQDFTISALDSLFGTNSDLNFVQRWFGGKGLRHRFVERQLAAFARRTGNHARAVHLRDTRCPLPPLPDSLRPPGPEKRKPKPEIHQYRKFRGLGRLLPKAWKLSYG